MRSFISHDFALTKKSLALLEKSSAQTSDTLPALLCVVSSSMTVVFDERIKFENPISNIVNRSLKGIVRIKVIGFHHLVSALYQ